MTTLRRFGADDRAAVLIVFALALLPIIALVGATIDYGHASQARSRLQSAVDGTALKLAREAGSLDKTQLQDRARTIFRSLLRPDRAVTVAVDGVKATRDEKKLRVAAQANVETWFMRSLGWTKLVIGSDAEVAWDRQIEIALVLDNTGSMNEIVNGRSKLEELKKAALGLIADVSKAAPGGGSVKVAIVPFDSQVRIDAGNYRYARWLAIDNSRRFDWFGYVADRGDERYKTDYDTNTKPADRSRAESLYPAELGPRLVNLAAVQPLVAVASGYTQLKNTIDDMRGAGCTNLTIGAAWGMATLTKGDVFTEAAPASAAIEKILILVTDGDNTKNRWDGDCREDNRDVLKIDGRTKLACDNAKKDGIRVITIRLLEGNRTLLEGCASKVSDKSDPFYRDGKPLYFEVQDPRDLGSAFRKIASMILGTRLTH